MGVKLSFSKLSTYIECPRKYFLSYIMKMGTGSSPHMSNGSAIHKCCEDFVSWEKEEQTLENLISYYQQIIPDIDENQLIHAIYEEVDEETGEIKKEVFINPTFEQKAIHSLKSFYQDYTENKFQQKATGRNPFNGPDRKPKDDNLEYSVTPKIILQEQWFNLKTKDGHEIRGLIDRVDEEPEGEHIVDYKSGKSRTPYKTLQDPLDIKALQLSIYALARYKETGKIPIRTSFFYLEPDMKKKDPKGEYRTAPKRTLEQLNKVEEFINDMGNEIENSLEKKEFPMGASPNCFWCDFKNNCEILAESQLEEMRNSFEIKSEKSFDIDTSDWDN